MPVPVENLNALARSLSIMRQGPPEAQPGQPVAFSLTPSLSDLRATDLVSSLVNVTWITKYVKFADQLPELDLAAAGLGERIVGGMPVSRLVGSMTGTLTGDLTGDLTNKLRADLAGKLAGSLVEKLTGKLTGTLNSTLDGTGDGVLNGEQKGTLIGDELGKLKGTIESALTAALQEEQTGINLEKPGVPGLLGQVAASFPVAVDVPVSVGVRWSVSRSADPADEGAKLGEGHDFRAPEGLTSPGASFVFAPQPVELTTTLRLDELAKLFVHASVELSAGGVKTGWIALPAVPVLIPRLPIPTVLALFVHRDFAAQSATAGKGGVLFVVPSDSPLRSFDELRPALSGLQGTVSALASFTRFAGFILGVQLLNDALGDHVALAEPDRVQFTSAIDDKVRHLDDFKFYDPLGPADLTAEDSISSIIFIGPPGRWVDCYIGRKLEDEEGVFKLTVAGKADGTFGDEMYTVVRTLRPRDPENDPMKTPASEPTGQEVTVIKPPKGDDTFHDELSSLGFGQS